ncbi:MAG TPA: hypothetical protein VFI13_13475 [Gemmatimonadales bacterium]|nr:hypothetical protein [Gemmatimonadales bacterium]
MDDRDAEAWEELCGDGRDGAGIDRRTRTDLDLDGVLAAIDRTQTGLGRQILYWRMRSGIAWTDTPALEALTTRLAHDTALREAVGVQLATGGRSLGHGFWVIARPSLIRVRWWYWSFPLLAVAMLTSVAAVPFVPRALLAVVALVVVNLVVRMATAWQIPGLLAPMRQMGPVIRAAERLSSTLGAADEGPAAILADVQRLRPLRRIARWVSRDPLASGEVLAAAWEYLNIMFVLDANALLLSARYLRQLGPVLTRVARWVGEVDVALSVASLRAEPRDWTIPDRSEGPRTRVRGLWHPLVASPVPNDAEMCPGAGAVITGANMSGKSTYLRTVGIAAVLARALGTCPAISWEGRAFRVRSLMGGNDDLAAGKSYYQVEADGVVGLLKEAREGDPTLFLLDELLRGTNTIERLAAGEAVLRALLADHGGATPHAVIVATHDGELVSMLEGLYSPFHFCETIGPGGLSFDYRRRVGPASSRTAIALLESTGAPKEVVEMARARAEQLDAAASRSPARGDGAS